MGATVMPIISAASEFRKKNTYSEKAFKQVTMESLMNSCDQGCGSCDYDRENHALLDCKPAKEIAWMHRMHIVYANGLLRSGAYFVDPMLLDRGYILRERKYDFKSVLHCVTDCIQPTVLEKPKKEKLTFAPKILEIFHTVKCLQETWSTTIEQDWGGDWYNMYRSEFGDADLGEMPIVSKIASSQKRHFSETLYYAYKDGKKSHLQGCDGFFAQVIWAKQNTTAPSKTYEIDIETGEGVTIVVGGVTCEVLYDTYGDAELYLTEIVNQINLKAKDENGVNLYNAMHDGECLTVCATTDCYELELLKVNDGSCKNYVTVKEANPGNLYYAPYCHTAQPLDCDNGGIEHLLNFICGFFEHLDAKEIEYEPEDVILHLPSSEYRKVPTCCICGDKVATPADISAKIGLDWGNVYSDTKLKKGHWIISLPGVGAIGANILEEDDTELVSIRESKNCHDSVDIRSKFPMVNILVNTGCVGTTISGTAFEQQVLEAGPTKECKTCLESCEVPTPCHYAPFIYVKNLDNGDGTYDVKVSVDIDHVPSAVYDIIVTSPAGEQVNETIDENTVFCIEGLTEDPANVVLSITGSLAGEDCTSTVKRTAKIPGAIPAPTPTEEGGEK